MQILKVTIINLASYKGEFTLDFTIEPLLSAGLYSIVGDTGSGKSTILDTICLALYGTAPRFKDGGSYNFFSMDSEGKGDDKAAKNLRNKNRNLEPSDPRNMLHWGARTCEAKVIFQGKDSRIYQATWSTSFAQTNYGDCYNTLYVQKEDGSFDSVHPVATIKNAHKLIGNKKKTQMQKIVDVVGLEYEEFTRSIMLAQNDFASFLKSSDKDKALTLEKITGTQIYTRVAQRIVIHSSEASRELEDFKRTLGEIEKNLLPEDKLEELKGEKAALTAEIERTGKEKERTVDMKKWKEGKQALENERSSHEREVSSLQGKITEAEPKRQSLSLHDRLQPILPTWTLLQSTRSSLSGQEGTMVPAAQDKIARCEKDFICASSLVGQAEQQKTAKEEARKAAIPLLLKARETLTRIRGKRDNLAAASTKLSSARTQAEKAKGEIERNRCAQEVQAGIITDSSVKEESFATVKEILERADLLKDRLSELLSSVDTAKVLNDTLQALQEELSKIESDLSKAEGKEKTSLRNLEELNAELCCVEERIRSVGESADLVARKDTLTLSRSNITPVLEAVPKLSKAMDDLRTDRGRLAVLEDREKEVSASLSAQRAESSSINKDLPGKTASLSLFKSKDLTKARKDLSEGSPCPLCGALHHPYTHLTGEGKSEGELMIEALENEIKKDRATLLDLDRSIRDLETSEKDLTSSISLAKSDISHLGEKVEELRSAILGSLSREGLSVPETLLGSKESLASLQSDMEKREGEMSAAIAQVQAQISDLQKLHSRRSALSKEREKASQDYDKAKDARTKAEGSLAIQKQKITTQTESLEKQQALTQSKRAAVEELSPCCLGVLFPPEAAPSPGGAFDWEGTFLFSPDAFIRKVLTAKEDYFALVERKDKAILELSTLRGAQKALEEAEKTSAENLGIAQAEYDALSAALQALEKESEGYFGGKDPDEVEKEMDEAIKAAAEALDIARGKKDAAATDLTLSRKELESLLSQIQKAKESVTDLEGQIRDFMVKSVPDISPDTLPTYLSDPDKWTELRGELQALDQEMAAAKSREGQVRQRLEAHLQSPDATDLSDEEIQKLIEDCEERINALSSHRTELDIALIRHDEARGALAARKDELDRLKAVSAKWQDLRAILGNAQADSLRRSVQSFTLSQLVQLANMHLGRMRSRYRLVQVPSTLSLKVIDTDFGDAERSVSGLSGGETFIVSLSLALGLSTLSSRGQGFPMLFIDEGFGTLSKEYLNTVIDALSTLQESDNKKVCVISHTPEMRERVAVKVEVLKEGNGGCSRLVVTPRQ